MGERSWTPPYDGSWMYNGFEWQDAAAAPPAVAAAAPVTTNLDLPQWAGAAKPGMASVGPTGTSKKR